jgi:hypothetical protein
VEQDPSSKWNVKEINEVATRPVVRQALDSTENLDWQQSRDSCTKPRETCQCLDVRVTQTGVHARETVEDLRRTAHNPATTGLQSEWGDFRRLPGSTL